MRTKNAFSLLVFLMAVLCISACGKEEYTTIINNGDCIEGEGKIITKTLSLDDFTSIDLAFSDEVKISQASEQKVEVTGHPNIIEKLITDVASGVWRIRMENGCYSNYKLSINITLPLLNSIKVSGSGDLYVGAFDNMNNDFKIQSSGSGDITVAKLSGQVESLELSLSGNGDIKIDELYGFNKLDATLEGSGKLDFNVCKGSTEFDISLSADSDFIAHKEVAIDNLKLTNSGSGDFSGFRINTKDCELNSSGSGKSEISVQNNLNVKISGSGAVSYKGNPSITKNISGSGKLIDAN